MEKDNFEIIEEYLLGNLPAEEKEVFEQRLGEDAVFKKEFDVMKAIFQSAEMSAKDKMKIDFENIHQRNFQTSKQAKSKIISIRPVYKIAASVLLLISCALAFWLLSNKSIDIPQDQLYANYFEPTELSFSYRGDDSNEVLETLQELFNTKDYPEFIDQLAAYNPDKDRDPALILAKGQAHLELDQFTRADEEFKSLLANPLYKDQANWYLGLMYVKQNKNAEALIYLDAVDRGSKYSKQAEEIMKRVR